ncbi:MAG: hypothetical protein OXR68_04240 [Alphaproteobacteria bacterium]|nr:hypothetical protein [Alphaproteobacteria bacterium]MDD9919817.1 hypothetical protein [Alphaproteobacteria bacterium]
MTSAVLDKVKGYFEQAVQAPAYQKWQKDAQEAWAFYDGNQWTDEEKGKLQENGQPPIVINKISAKVDNIAGTEVAGRTRILYRSRSGEATEEATARALSDLALYVAERNDQAIEISNVFKSGLVTGIGWLDIGVEEVAEGPFIFNRYEDEASVVWDSAARRLDFSDARFVCRERWLDEEELKQFFPTKSEQVLQQLKRGGEPLKTFTGDSVSYINEQEQLVRVVEVQYRQTEKQYTVQLPDGTETVTFDKTAAYNVPDGEVTSRFQPRVYVAYFSENTLLSHTPLAYQHNRFTLVPYIFKRHKEDGRPYGLVRSAIDPQRELNKRRSKAMHLLNTAQVIADIDAVEDPNLLAREAARPDGMILKRPGKELRIIRNSELAQSQVTVMDQAAQDIQEVMGVFDETIGKNSNAVSGVAIQQRQLAGSLNQMFAFDALRRVKKQLGHQILSLIRQYFTHEMVIQLTDSFQAARLVQLNRKEQQSDGTEFVHHDVKSGVFDVLVEEVRDAVSGRELDMQQLNMLMQSGVEIPQKLLVEATTLSNKEEILRHMGEKQQNLDALETEMEKK